MRQDVYQRFTNLIVAELEKGARRALEMGSPLNSLRNTHFFISWVATFGLETQ